MNSAIGVFVILCLSIAITNCETSKQQDNDLVHSENHKDVTKVVNIDIKNDGGGVKISLPTGDIYVPSERKNVHIKTIDVFEEKNPMSQPDKCDEPSTEEERSDEDVQKTRSKKPMYGPQTYDNPQAFYYIPNNQFLGNNGPQPNPYRMPLNTNPIMNHQEYPFAYQLMPINQIYPYQYPPVGFPYNQQPFIQSQNGFNEEVTKPVNKNPFFNYFYSKIKPKKGIAMSGEEEENSAVLQSIFQLIAKNVLHLFANFLNITLPAVTHQLIHGVSTYLFP